MRNRRDIFKFAGGAVAGALFTPAPWRLITDTALWSENWPGVPRPARGEIRAKFTNCALCPAGCAVRARCVGDQPVSLAGVGGGFLDGSLFETRGVIGQVMGGDAEGAQAAADAGEGNGLIHHAAGTDGATGGTEGAIGELGADFAARGPGNAGPVFTPECGIRDQAPRGRREESARHGAAGEFEDVSTVSHLWQAHL